MDIVKRIEEGFPEISVQMHDVPDRFDPGWLKQAAVTVAGLDDFGDDRFEDPLARLCHSLDDEADLNAYGRFLVAGVIRNQLVNRLLLQRLRKDAQERLNEPLVDPIIVTGLPRTGTTFLHRLLSADPAHTALPYWQVARPVPLHPEDTAQARIAEVNQIIDVRRRLTPEFDSVHLIRAEQPEECLWMTGVSMMTRLFWNLAPVFSYQHWLSRADKTAKYRDYRDLLHYLQEEYPGRRLVLKAPEHNDGLCELLSAIPNARVVITHRDMLAQLGSYLSLGRTTRQLAVNTTDVAKEAEATLDMTEISLSKMAQARARFGDRILDVRYDAMMANPLCEVERIYQFCGLTLPEARRTAIADHHAKNPKGKHGKHDYSLDEFGLNSHTVRAQFSEYEAEFLP